MAALLNKKAKHLITWRRGERAAAKFLKEKGYEILVRNYRCKQGEIDIIARDGRYLCFIEVKTRKLKREEKRSLKYTPTVSLSQINRIKNAAKDYMVNLKIEKILYRFELIEIFIGKFGIITDIYHWSENFGKIL